MGFFPDDAPPEGPDEPAPLPEPSWHAAPDDVLPGVVPLELVIGRSERAVVMLTGIRAFPTGLEMTLGVRVRGRVRRGELSGEVFDGPYAHDMDARWRAGRLKWGFELAGGTRVTNVDPPAWSEQPGHPDGTWEPDHPVLTGGGGGGGGGERSVDRSYWLWPLPPAGPLRVVCQWPEQDIGFCAQDLDAQLFRDAAGRSKPLWD